jgi:two-component system, OmpR family, phosphate regulon response regulator PhoB
MFHILLVEDLEECQIVVKRAFANTAFHVTTAETVQTALSLLQDRSTHRFDFVILDLGLPDGDGLVVLEALVNRDGDSIPVFLLTSDEEIDSKVNAFNLGADDYLVKPISGVELRARVEMRAKKAMAGGAKSVLLNRGNLLLDTSVMKASIKEGVDTQPLALTAKEFKILALLMRKEGQVYSRQDLVKNIWGDSVYVQERTVDSHIFGLRKKLSSYAEYIECIPNLGYRFISHPQQKSS